MVFNQDTHVEEGKKEEEMRGGRVNGFVYVFGMSTPSLQLMQLLDEQAHFMLGSGSIWLP